MKVTGIIPCRYASTRLEGKPLASIGGRPMFWHVFQRTRQARCLHEVRVATDDERIAGACRDLGVPFELTSPDHLTGTDRVAECAARSDADVIVNVQGDEPFIDPATIDAVAAPLLDDAAIGLAVTNACCPISSETELADRGVVKVVFSRSHRALAYSRLPIPLAFPDTARPFRQLGLYAFRREALRFFAAANPGPLERAESVELYRFLEHDRPVLMVEVAEAGLAVDTPEDLEKARRQFAENRG